MLVNQVFNILLSLQFIGSGVAQTNRDGTSVDMQAATPTNSARRARKVCVFQGWGQCRHCVILTAK